MTKQLDAILSLIQKKTDCKISKEELKTSSLYDRNLLIFLSKNGYVKFDGKGDVETIELTTEGKDFIEKGGYTNVDIKTKTDRVSNIIYLIATPIIALVALIISICALFISKKQPLIFENQSHFYFSNPKDTTVSKCDTIPIFNAKSDID